MVASTKAAKPAAASTAAPEAEPAAAIPDSTAAWLDEPAAEPALTEPSDVLVPGATPDGTPGPEDAVFIVGLLMGQPDEQGQREIEVKLKAREIADLLSQKTQWVMLPQLPHSGALGGLYTHPLGMTRYVNVLNQVQEIRVYGDWTPGN